MKYSVLILVLLSFTPVVGQDGGNWIHSFDMSTFDEKGRGSAEVTVVGSSPSCFSQEITANVVDGVLEFQLFEEDHRLCHLDLRYEPLSIEYQFDEAPRLVQALRVFTDNGRSDGIVVTTRGPYILEELVPHIPGDSDLSRIFDSGDLVNVFRGGEFEDDLVGNSTWFSGDWNGDGEFDSSDFVLAFNAGQFTRSRSRAVSIPEPSMLLSFTFAAIGIVLHAVRGQRR